MRAVTIRAHGGPEVVRLQDLPEPRPGPGDVVLEVRAAAINHLDIWVRNGRPGMALRFPHVLGSDAAGVVAETGPGVVDLGPGQEVLLNPALWCGRCEWCLRGEQSECPDFTLLGLGRPGTFAERVAAPASCVHPKPAHLNFAQAAALPLAHVTAWRMLLARGALGPGETVLIHGIGGGVALAALRFAKAFGARVFVTSSSDEKLARARSLGADHALNYRAEPDVAKWVRGETAGRGVDLVLDTVGAATWAADFAAVRRGGRIVLCGVTTGPRAETPLNVLYWNQVSVLGSTMGAAEDFRRMLRWVGETRFEPVLDSVRPLAEAPAALRQMEAGAQFGKIVLQVGG
jgi:NADPH:quinone reductase-like Zn-dependent oxidoreductase